MYVWTLARADKILDLGIRRVGKEIYYCLMKTRARSQKHCVVWIYRPAKYSFAADDSLMMCASV